jgi:lactoylglutathione lyase
MFGKSFPSVAAVLGVLAAFAPASAASAQDGAPHANRLINTTLFVQDLDRAAKFYIEGLGMHERGRRQASKDVTEFSVGYSSDPRVAEVMLVYNKAQAAKAPGEAPAASSRSWGHIILEVTDLKTTLENVARAGGRVTSQPAANASVPVIVAFVEDPDGHRFELVQFK